MVDERAAGSNADDCLLVDVPQDDPIRPIITSILGLVAVSHWSFARFKGDGNSDQLLSATGNTDEFQRIKKQFVAQRDRVGTGPGIAATLGPLGSYESGLTLLFADNRMRFGILTLLRTGELGPFTSSEIRALTFALDAASDHLSELRLMESEDERIAGFRLDDAAQPPAPDVMACQSAQYILNRELDIVLAWTNQNERCVATTPLAAPLENRLPLVVEEAIRELTAAWTTNPQTQHAGVSQPVPFLVVRTRPMAGPIGLFIGVTIERSKPDRSLTDAAKRFSISPREAQVLALLLDGAQLNVIAERLHITSSTVQDHLTNLLRKTDTQNRSSMISKVLGWEQPHVVGSPHDKPRKSGAPASVSA